MRRRDLLQLIADAARDHGTSWRFMRQGSTHEIWAIDGRQIAVPRHREINELTARAILRSLETEMGTRWWER